MNDLYPLFSLSASYSNLAECTQSYIQNQTLAEQKDKEVKDFFVSLGYEVEQNGRYCRPWWEIFKDGLLVCQVDTGVSLQDIIDDMSEMALGNPGISKTNYIISGEDSDDLTELFYKVRNSKINISASDDYFSYEI